MTAEPRKSLEGLSPVNVRQIANTLHGMAEDYGLAIEAAQKVSAEANVSNMEHKQMTLRSAHRILMFMLGVET